MTRISDHTLATALVAASLLSASAAFAGGDYYVGGSPDAVKPQSRIAATFRNGHPDHRISRGSYSVPAPYDSGDYRPAGIDK